MLKPAFETASELLANTQMPDQPAIEGFDVCREYIQSAPDDQKLERLQEIVEAHTNAWKDTIGNFAKLHEKTVNRLLESVPELMYLEDDLKKDIVQITKIGKDIERGNITQKYNVAGTNFWSPKKQEVSQLFELVKYIPDSQQYKALEMLENAGEAIGPAMLEVAEIENNLLKLAGPYTGDDNELHNQVLGILESNAPYHKSVGHDWSVLKEAAQIHPEI